MSIQETVHELTQEFKKDEIKELQKKIDTLEKVIINLINRLDYLESRCQ